MALSSSRKTNKRQISVSVYIRVLNRLPRPDTLDWVGLKIYTTNDSGYLRLGLIFFFFHKKHVLACCTVYCCFSESVLMHQCIIFCHRIYKVRIFKLHPKPVICSCYINMGVHRFKCCCCREWLHFMMEDPVFPMLKSWYRLDQLSSQLLLSYFQVFHLLPFLRKNRLFHFLSPLHTKQTRWLNQVKKLYKAV